MVDFYNILVEVEEELAYNPYAGEHDNNWKEGLISIDFLNDNFGEYETATEMKNSTNSEGLKKFFDYLVEQRKLEE